MGKMIAPLASAFGVMHGYWAVLRYALVNLRVLCIAPVRNVFHRQIYFTGIQSLWIVAILAMLCGTLVVTQVSALFGGNSEMTVRVLIWTIVREVGPLLAATIIIARSSPAIATELALMKSRNEFDHLVGMHIPPEDYLIVPRIAGVTLAVIALSVYFQIAAIGGGLAISAAFQGISFLDQLNHFLQIVSFWELLSVALKSGLFGMAISSISCYHGMHAASSVTGVPKAAIRAVIQSLLFIFLIDALMAYVYFGIISA